MTLTSTDRVIRYMGNDSATEFPFPFIIPDANSIIVSLVTPSTGAITEIPPASYIVTGLANPLGGVVIYPPTGSPISSTTQLVISREVPVTQTVEITNQTRYNASVVMGVWDKIVMMVQELREVSERTLRLRVGSSLADIPDLSADKVLKVDAIGAGLEWGPSVSEISAAQGYATEAKNAAIAAAASAALVAYGTTVSAYYDRDGGSTPITLPVTVTDPLTVLLNVSSTIWTAELWAITGDVTLTPVGEWPRDARIQATIRLPVAKEVIDAYTVLTEAALPASAGTTVQGNPYRNCIVRYQMSAGVGVYTRYLDLPTGALLGDATEYHIRFDATSNPKLIFRDGVTELTTITNFSAVSGTVRCSFIYTGAAWIERYLPTIEVS